MVMSCVNSHFIQSKSVVIEYLIKRVLMDIVKSIGIVALSALRWNARCILYAQYTFNVLCCTIAIYILQWNSFKYVYKIIKMQPKNMDIYCYSYWTYRLRVNDRWWRPGTLLYASCCDFDWNIFQFNILHTYISLGQVSFMFGNILSHVLNKPIVKKKTVTLFIHNT